ncbi:MAG: thioredoxin fold domain-containing protein [Holophagales bacterium]|nr:thioredoxin fold domain-containing protein [Holophagales bacterium]
MRRFALIAALALAAAASPAGRADAQGIAFSEGTPFAEVLRRGRTEKKPVMLDAYAVWCGPCKQLDRQTFADPTVGAWARKNVFAAKVDAEKGEGRRLSQRYAVRAFPTILFLDAAGNEIDRISGVYPPADFIRVADAILAGKTPLAEAMTKIKTSWDPAMAGSVAAQLAQRNDLPRLSVIARRAAEEDPDLIEPGSREAFLYFVSLEDGAGKLSSETLDLIESVAPRLSADPRVAILRLAASREQSRRGDGAAARASALAGLKGLDESSPFAADLQGALAVAERTAKKPAAAVAAARKAVALAEKSGGGAWGRVSGQVALAETLAFAGQNDEARKTLGAALGPASNDPGLLVRASALLLVLKDVPGALAHARRAVEVSQGGDAAAHAALGEALAASGDPNGAGSEFARAAELEPENAAFRRRLEAFRPKKGAKAA